MRRHVSVTAAVLVGVALGVVQAQAPAPPNPPWASQVDAVFSQWDRPGSPGCALGIYKDGQIVYARGYGLADLEHDAPITPDSVFYAGSVSRGCHPSPLFRIPPPAPTPHGRGRGPSSGHAG